MNRVVAASFAVLLSSVTLAAQSSAFNQTGPQGQSFGVSGMASLSNSNADPQTVVTAVPVTHACPVSMRAQQQSNQALMNAHNGQSAGVAQRIRLTVGNMPSSAPIKGVRVVIHGTRSKARTIPAVYTEDGVSDAAKAFDLPFALGPREDASANLLLRGFTSIQSVTLESVTYTDGSSWNPAPGRSCRTALDSLVLLSDRQKTMPSRSATSGK